MASVILLVAVGMSMAGLSFFLRGAYQNQIQNELDIDVQTSIERLKRDIRLSSLTRMFFYPAGAGPYTAISFPMAADNDGDGAVDLDADGRIVWSRTLIYHVWAGNPQQLRLTVFDPRDEGLTDVQRQEQIDSVVFHGSGSLTHNGAHAHTTVVFENLFDWEIVPRGSTFDAYAPELMRDVSVSLGSSVVGSGPQTFTFTVVGRNADSTGHRVGLDTLFMSPSYGEREAEAQLPATAYSGAGEPVRQYMAGGSWSGNHQLLFPANAENASFVLTMENDRWEETNFKGTGSVQEDTTVEFDQSLSPHDFVVRLSGLGFNWWASEQTGDAGGAVSGSDQFRAAAVRVLIRGEDMQNGNWIYNNGGYCYISFRSGAVTAQKLRILGAYIAESASSQTPGMDAAPGTSRQLLFGGSSSVTIDGGSSWWSDMTDYPIDRRKSYLVTFLAANSEAHGNAWTWRPSVDGYALTNAFVISGTNSPGLGDIAADVWSTRGDVVSTQAVVGVQAMYTTYATNGVYVSQPFDTRLESPSYSTIDWSASVPWGGSLSLQLRSGNQGDMSDAPPWTNVTAMAAPGAVSPGNGRYVQFRALMRPGAWGWSTPKLRNVTVRWPGVERFVDIGGTFTKGPDYGVFEMRVNGELIKTGLNIDLRIFRDATSFVGSRRILSAATMEVIPRNTGR